MKDATHSRPPVTKSATPERILVTPRSLTRAGHPALQRLTRAGYKLILSSPGQQPDEDELRRLLPGCVGYLCGVEKVSARALEVAAELRVISRNGTGVDNIDLAAARRRQVQICRAEGANARGVAELTLALMLALVRAVPFSENHLKQGSWERRQGIELGGRTLGLVGCGRVGRLVTQFALAFDMKVRAYDPFPDVSFHPSDRFEFATMEALWKEAEIISLHCPPSSGALPLIRRETCAGLRRGVYIINTARAALVDEDAALSALDSGQIEGLATDVFDEEPPNNHRFIRHPKVIATPHIGAFTEESISRAVEAAVDNLMSALKTFSIGN
jgi:D-3-phosphoglycerate dehydrogenase / 2-oxoglutarate reductase